MTDTNNFIKKRPKPIASEFETLKKLYYQTKKELLTCQQKSQEIISQALKTGILSFKRKIDLYEFLHYAFHMGFEPNNDFKGILRMYFDENRQPNMMKSHTFKDYQAYFGALLLYLDVQNEETLKASDFFSLYTLFSRKFPDVKEYTECEAQIDQSLMTLEQIIGSITFGNDPVIVNLNGKLINLNSGEDYILSEDSIEFLTECADTQGVLLQGAAEEDIPEIKKHIEHYYQTQEDRKKLFNHVNKTYSQWDAEADFWDDYGYTDSLANYITERIARPQEQKVLKKQPQTN